ncbi:MAG: hypothetical protein A2Y09_06965 [Planctomycetes bacterium GWA2_39_15]|nr:MAG: hypothetical protein A2Y09_06965 [Planctomycetes bacterium GWA2_39_15]
MKALRGTPKHLSRSGQMEGFTYLMFTLPFKCNYLCPKCFNLVNNVPITSGIPITLQDILQKIEESKELGGKVVVVAGEGEPTMDPNIREIISKIDSMGMIPVLYSNGSTLTPEVATFYRKNNISLVIAVDSLSDETYDLLTGTKHMFPKVLKNIEVIRKIYSDTIEEKNGLRTVRIAINATVTSRNRHEIKSIKEFCGDDIYFVCNPLARYGNAVANWDKLIEENDYSSHTELIGELSESGGPLTLDKVGLCGYSINGIGISPQGDYMTCAYTSMTNGLLGNIRDTSLSEAYHSKYSFEKEHYQKHGNAPCLVRDTQFVEYIEKLKTNTEKIMMGNIY